MAGLPFTGINMTVRFITAWNGYKPGDTATFSGPVETAMIAGLLARDNAENDNSGGTDLQTQVTALDTQADLSTAKLAAMLVDYADDAAAAAGGVAVGGFYSVSGVVHKRVA